MALTSPMRLPCAPVFHYVMHNCIVGAPAMKEPGLGYFGGSTTVAQSVLLQRGARGTQNFSKQPLNIYSLDENL